MRYLLSGLICVMMLCAAVAADKKSKFKVGDKVIVDWGGPKTGEVVEITGTGWLKVRIKQKGGIEQTPVFPPEQVKAAGKGGKNADKKKAAANNAELRTWASKSGNFKIKAKFVKLDDDQLTLEKEDGDTVTVALGKLSEADQKTATRLAENAEENPFESEGENPFKSDAKEASDADDDEPPEGDWSEVEQVVIEDPGQWSLAPDAAPAPSRPLASKPVVLMSAAKKKGKAEAFGFFEKIEGLLFNRSMAEGFVVSFDNASGGSPLARVQHVDLAQGKADAPIEVPDKVKAVDIDPSGKRLLARSDFFVSGNAPAEVSVWDLGATNAKRVQRWSPHDPGNAHKTAPNFAQFLDSDHILTSEFPGRLALWQVSGAKAVYRLELANGGVPALSATRKYLAAPVGNSLYLFESLTGKTLAKLPGDPGVVSGLSFNINGKQLASLSPQRLIVWNLENGELYRDIYFPTPLNTSSIDWLAHGYVLLGGEKLIDLERRIVLWQYQHDVGGGQGYGEMGGYFWYVISNHGRQERGLFRAKLPHDEPIKIAAGLNAEQLLAIKPGAQISVDVAVQGDQQTVSQTLIGQLQNLGMTVAPGGRLVLRATTEAGKTQEVYYRGFGRNRGIQHAQVTEQIARAKFIEDGKVLWEATSVRSNPHMLKMKEGQSLQDALAPYQKPNIEFFSHVKLPQYVARPHEKGAYGASKLSFQGILPSQVSMPKPGG
ncbi:MAG TPA: SHD1 domain-containing protein [Pirellulales bacterium]|nr:SHD1 domain-containing protein [Pirellulales bacterium]